MYWFSFGGGLFPAVLERDREEHYMKLSRKEMKRRGRRSLKGHYLLFVAACLLAALISAEFKGSLSAVEAQTYVDPSLEENVVWHGWDINLGDALGSLFPAGGEEDNPVFGRTRGVLASVVNLLSGGSILATLAAAAGSLLGSENAGILLLVLAGAVVMFLFWLLIQNVYPVVLRRAFLEGRTYEKVPLQRFLYLLRVKKWLRVAWAMFVRAVFYLLWGLTIVGAVVKRYYYYLVPYILAENPDIPARQAITLSRRMMDGHKWRCFLFEVSFLGWMALGALTGGLVNLFYTNPYKTAAFTEYYAQMRARAKAENLPGAELLNDDYLYEKADRETISASYADVIAVLESPPVDVEFPTGFRAFLAKWFGLVIFPSRQEKAYEQDQARRLQVEDLEEAVRGEAYPTRLFPIPERGRRPAAEGLNFVRHYSIWSIMVIFLGCSFIGWLWEVSLHLVTHGELVNRGVLHGPWLPIYGSGAVLILLLLNRLRKHPLALFLATIVLCGTLEYSISLILEITSGGVRWWDYSGYFLNLNGRICAEGLLVFGIGGLAIVYVLAPLVDNLMQKVDGKLCRTLCLIVMAVFLTDWTYSQFHPNQGEGITAGSQLNTPAAQAEQVLSRQEDPDRILR